MHVIEAFDIDLLLRTGRQVDQGGLAGAIACAVRDIYGAGTRGDVENAPATLLSEGRYQKSHQIVRSVEIDGKVANELSRVLILNLWPRLADTR